MRSIESIFQYVYFHCVLCFLVKQFQLDLDFAPHRSKELVLLVVAAVASALPGHIAPPTAPFQTMLVRETVTWGDG